MSSSLYTTTEHPDFEIENFHSILSVAAKEVFSMMVETELGTPEADPKVLADITAIVGLAGRLRGICIVRCGAASARKLASRMIGAAGDASAHAHDAVAEICNMVAGNFKAKIPGLEDKCMLSVPTVIIGNSYKLQTPAGGKRIDLPLLFEQEPVWFTLEIRG